MIWPGEDVGRRSRDIQRQCSQKRSFLIEGPGIQKRQRHLSFRWPQPLPTLENVSQNFKGWSCCLCRYCGCTSLIIAYVHPYIGLQEPTCVDHRDLVKGTQRSLKPSSRWELANRQRGRFKLSCCAPFWRSILKFNLNMSSLLDMWEQHLSYK